MPPSLASHCDLLIDVIILDYGLITDNMFDTLLCFFLLKLPGTHGFFFCDMSQKFVDLTDEA